VTEQYLFSQFSHHRLQLLNR